MSKLKLLKQSWSNTVTQHCNNTYNTCHMTRTVVFIGQDAAAVVKKFMARDPSNLNFTLVALVQDWPLCPRLTAVKPCEESDWWEVKALHVVACCKHTAGGGVDEQCSFQYLSMSLSRHVLFSRHGPHLAMVHVVYAWSSFSHGPCCLCMVLS